MVEHRNGAGPQERKAIEVLSQLFYTDKPLDRAYSAVELSATPAPQLQAMVSKEKQRFLERHDLAMGSDGYQSAIKALAKDPRKEREILAELRDYENTGLAIKALAATDQPRYWEAGIFKANFHEMQRQSTQIETDVWCERQKMDAGERRKLGLERDPPHPTSNRGTMATMAIH